VKPPECHSKSAINLTPVTHQHRDDERTIFELFSAFYDQTIGIQSPSEGSLDVSKYARFTETWHPALIGNCASNTEIEHCKNRCSHQKNLKHHWRISGTLCEHPEGR